MNIDFTLKIYTSLLEVLIVKGYNFQTFSEFILLPKDKSIILRHDVDLKPQNSLIFAKIQFELGIKGVYYFRAVKESWNESIIKEISSLGHEIGYHYENLTTTSGDVNHAFIDFKLNLEKLRKISDVKTICMHGSPMSKYDSKDIWNHFDYRECGIIGEPYFDINFNEVFYLTDTGRSWNGVKTSVRDRVNSSYNIPLRSTSEIIDLILENNLPKKVMFTFHPQRWHSNIFLWLYELIFQNFKNIIKRLLYVK